LVEVLFRKFKNTETSSQNYLSYREIVENDTDFQAKYDENTLF